MCTELCGETCFAHHDIVGGCMIMSGLGKCRKRERPPLKRTDYPSLPHGSTCHSNKLTPIIPAGTACSYLNFNMHSFSISLYITMFLQRVAGPSRLPYRAVESVARRYNSTAPPASAEPTGDELADRDSRTAFSREKAIWASNEGYKRWKSSSGNQYKAIPRGQKAAWLGGHVVCSHLAGFVEFALTL